MRLVLNKVASENITDLFPTDWHPRPTISSVQEKQYKALTEVMTEMFQQCGLLIETDIMEMDNYRNFLKVLQHHIYIGKLSTTQLTHFIILRVYMSFCRLNHYTQYMPDKDAVLLKEAVQMTLVIMAFKTSFSVKGGHNKINPYFKNIPSEVRRNVHIITSRYMEQECTCQNHVQCDFYPTLLTSQVVLPSYQHFLQHLQLTGMTKLFSNESDALSQYGKTILMLILVRVNGYYNPYIPQTIMEEEAKIRYGDVFSPAEKEFFRHRLLTLYPKIDDRSVKTAIEFLEQQKAVNCPCSVHTVQRGYEWIVFRRQPDRKSWVDEDDEDDVIPMDEVSDDEDFFSAEAEKTIPTPTSDERTQVDQDISDEIKRAASETTPEADFSSADLSDGCKTIAKPQMSDSLCELSLHSRDKTNSKTKKKTDQNNKKKNDV